MVPGCGLMGTRGLPSLTKRPGSELRVLLIVHHSKSNFLEACQIACQLAFRQHSAQLVTIQDDMVMEQNF